MGGMCTTGEKVPNLQRLKYDMTPIESNPTPIIWIVGPSGTGRHRHAATLAHSLELENILISELLENESSKATDRGSMIKNGLQDPLKKVPDEIVIDLIKESMLRNVQQKRGFLLNGFPRTSNQANIFVKEIVDVDVIVFLYSDIQVLLNRVKLKRQNVDCNALKKNFQNYLKETKAGVSKFGEKLEKINTDGPLGVVYGRIEAAINIRLNALPQLQEDFDKSLVCGAK